MGRDGRRDGARGVVAAVLPQVAQGVAGGAGQADGTGGGGDALGGAGLVEQGDRAAAVLHLLGHDPAPARGGHDGALPAQRVLVDGDDVLVAQDVEGRRGGLAQIGADEQRRGHDRPQGEVRAVLGVRHAAVADLQHVGVVPVAGARMGGEREVLLEDRQHRTPAVADVTGGPPQVADVRRPLPRLVLAPFADAVDDGPPGRLEGVAHGAVALLRVDAEVVAVVVLEVVHAPVGELLCVAVLVAERARESRAVAGLEAGAGVDAELEALGVDIVRDGLDAVREAGRVGHQLAVRVAVRQGPAVVEVDVPVAGVLEALVHEQVRDPLDHGLVEVGSAVRGVPVVEAHRRGEGEAVGQGGGGGGLGGGRDGGGGEARRAQQPRGERSGHSSAGCARVRVTHR